MSEQKTLLRFFTVADYEDEERWLRRQHNEGWKLAKMVPPCVYVFERCEPEDVIYRLDYQNNQESGDYFQMYADYGWENCGRCAGWLYFRKSAAQMDGEQDGEIFSDNASRVDMVRHIVRTRMLPLLIIFFAAVLPNFFARNIWSDGFWPRGFALFWDLMFLLYLFLFVHCGLKLRALRRKYSNES